MRFRFHSDTNQELFKDALDDEHFPHGYGRTRYELETGKLPEHLKDMARDLGADIDE